MSSEVPSSLPEKSKFQQKLDADPALRERCEAIVKELRKAAEKDLGRLLHYDFTTEEMRELRVASF